MSINSQNAFQTNADRATNNSETASTNHANKERISLGRGSSSFDRSSTIGATNHGTVFNNGDSGPEMETNNGDRNRASRSVRVSTNCARTLTTAENIPAMVDNNCANTPEMEFSRDGITDDNHPDRGKTMFDRRLIIGQIKPEMAGNSRDSKADRAPNRCRNKFVTTRPSPSTSCGLVGTKDPIPFRKSVIVQPTPWPRD